jgi:PAS domain S-box-containing protein
MMAISVLSLPDPEFQSILETFVAKTNLTIIITDGNVSDDTRGPIIQYANAAAEQAAGYSSDELIGQPLGLLYPAASVPQVVERMREASERRTAVEFETQSIKPNGKMLWMQVSTVAVFGAKGRVSNFVRVGRDVTARKRVEMERETSQRLLASVFGVIDQALGVIDDTGKFSMVNTAVTRQFGWSVFDLIGKPFVTVLDEGSRKSVERQLSAREEQDQTLRILTNLRHRDGTVMPGEIVSTIILQPDNRRYRVLTLIPKSAVAAAPQAASGSTIEASIRNAVKQSAPAALTAGRLQLVGLAAVRQEVGERWVEISEQVFKVAERILRRHLLTGDTFHRTADDGFLVYFADLSAPEAQLKAKEIAQEIRDRLISDVPEMQDTGVEAFAARVSIEAHETGSDQAVIQALENRLSRERKRLESSALDTLRSGLPIAQVSFQKLRTDTNQAAPFAFTRLPRPLESSLETLQALGRTDYTPEAEMLLLTGSAERLLSELTLNKTDVLIVPVRITTLIQRRDAERWLQIARTVGRPGKQRVVVEIGELARDIARTRMTDVVMMVSSIFRAVAFELPVADPAFVAGLPTSVPLVTIPVRRLANDDGGGHAQAAAKLLKALAMRNIRLIVKGVTSPTLAMALSKVGVTLILTAPEDRPPAP